MVDVPVAEEEGLGVVAQHDLGAVPRIRRTSSFRSARVGTSSQSS